MRYCCSGPCEFVVCCRGPEGSWLRYRGSGPGVLGCVTVSRGPLLGPCRFRVTLVVGAGVRHLVRSPYCSVLSRPLRGSRPAHPVPGGAPGPVTGPGAHCAGFNLPVATGWRGYPLAGVARVLARGARRGSSVAARWGRRWCSARLWGPAWPALGVRPVVRPAGAGRRWRLARVLGPARSAWVARRGLAGCSARPHRLCGSRPAHPLPLRPQGP